VIASLTADIADAYRDGIVDAGKQPELFVLVAFLFTFGFVRMSTHLIRRNVRWWPGNLEVKGTHVHHLVWGILLLLLVGYMGIALEPASPWQEVLAILFGIAAALTLDEFALWLNLRDVYWSHQRGGGRSTPWSWRPSSRRSWCSGSRSGSTSPRTSSSRPGWWWRRPASPASASRS
jgi:hypothetical protein